MQSPTPEAPLRRRYEAAGQGHVFAALARLDAAARGRLLGALDAIDLDLVAELARLAQAPAPARPARFEPARVLALKRGAQDEDRVRRAIERGTTLLEKGRVGYLVVAGGQASRLGLDAPKGCLPVGPVSGRSLFELFARKLLAAESRHGPRAPWYVMTSPATDAQTRAFFAEHGHFGLDVERVFFFQQSVLPALDAEGRILMAAPDAPFLAPNGHGGVLSGLAASGALGHAREHGVEHFSYFQVDNPLARPADPLFVGLHALERAQMSSKVVRRTDPDEKVGVLGRVDGNLSCIEYSDLPEDLRHARDAAGDLLFWAGNIAAHVLDREFVEELTASGLRLPWHVARKRIPCVDDAGRAIEREGFKFETFVFDALAQARASVTLEVDRAREFSPVKNRTGPDSPATARRDQCRLFGAWVARAGLSLPAVDASGVHPVEIDPLLAESADEFLASLPRQPKVLPAGHLYEP